MSDPAEHIERHERRSSPTGISSALFAFYPHPELPWIWPNLRALQRDDVVGVDHGRLPALHILIGTPIFMTVWVGLAWFILTVILQEEKEHAALLRSIRDALLPLGIGFIVFMYVGCTVQQARVRRKGPVLEIDLRRRTLRARGKDEVPFDRLLRFEIVAHGTSRGYNWRGVWIVIAQEAGGEEVVVPVGKSNGSSFWQIPKVFGRLARELGIPCEMSKVRDP